MRARPDRLTRKRPRILDAAVPVHAEPRHDVAEVDHHEAHEQAYHARNIDRARAQRFGDADAGYRREEQQRHKLNAKIGVAELTVIFVFRVDLRQEAEHRLEHRRHRRNHPQLRLCAVIDRAVEIPVHRHLGRQTAVHRRDHHQRQQRQHPRRSLLFIRFIRFFHQI